MLPGQVIDIAESVVRQASIIRSLITECAQSAVLEILRGKSLISLIGKGDADNRITIGAKLTCSIDW